MFAISFILTYQDNRTLKIWTNHTLCPLWLVYDIYLPSSETPPFSRQTVVAEQINAPTVCLKFQKLFCFLIKRIINQNNLKQTLIDFYTKKYDNLSLIITIKF